MSEREKRLCLRRRTAAWQAGTVGLLIVAVVTNMVLYGLLLRQEQETAAWESKYRAVRAIERDAVAAYGELVARVDAEQEAREAQAAAFGALGGYEYIGECELTAYCCESEGNPHICGNGDGLTATGLPVAPGMVAVDPAVIPLGSTVIIDGTSYLAADTGVSGMHIDIAVQTHEEALDFGTRTAQVWVIREDKTYG